MTGITPFAYLFGKVGSRFFNAHNDDGHPNPNNLSMRYHGWNKY